MDLIASLAGLLTADEWQAAAAVGTFVVAVAAAIVALVQVREAARLRSEQSRPYVVVHLDRAGTSVVDLVVKNFGTTAARDVRIEWDRAPTMRWGSDSGPLQLFENLPLLAPGAEWRTVWDTGGHRIEDQEPAYTAMVMANDARGRALPREHFVLDTHQFANELRMERHGLHQIAESIKKIERTTSSWTDGLRGLNVYRRDGDAKDRRDVERRESRRRSRAESVGQAQAAAPAE